MKRQLNFWMLLLPLALGIASCSENIDNPVPPTSAVDEGEWNVDVAHMDRTVSPGDNFFLYCNGGWWDSTTLEGNTMIKMPTFDQIGEWIGKAVASLDIPAFNKLKADFSKVTSKDTATFMAMNEKIYAALRRIDATTTKEEIWKLSAQLMTEGYRTPFSLDLFSRGGKLAVVLLPYSNPNRDFQPLLAPEKNPVWQLTNNSDLLAHVQPLKAAGRRAFDTNEWPMMAAMYEVLGISPDDAYIADALPHIILGGYDEMLRGNIREIQNMSLEEWKKFLSDMVIEDALYYDDGLLAQLNAATQSSATHEALLTNFANKYLGYDISRALADNYITADMKQRVTENCNELRQTFRERIQKNEWMSEASKQIATDKLNAITFNIGAPDEWIQEGFADLTNEQTLLDDILSLRRTKFNWFHKMIGTSTVKNSFQLTMTNYSLTTVNAFYMPNANSINIYPAFMVAPCYDPKQNDAHNYATMMVFGHELTHGFDNNGAKYNKIGDLEDIWATDTDRQEFARRAQMLIDHYSAMDVMPYETGLKNDGQYTAGENIADLGGIHLAYDTYTKHLKNNGFTGEQLQLQQRRFYEALAYLWCSKWTPQYATIVTNGIGENHVNKDVHSLNSERINGTVPNIDDWYRLFHVGEKDKLYLAPENRIRIW